MPDELYYEQRREVISIWRNATLFLAGMVLSGGIAWATYVRTAVTSSQVQAMIEENQKVLQVEIDQLNKQSDSVNAKLDEILVSTRRAR